MNIRAKIYGGTEAAEESLLRTKKPKGSSPEGLDGVSVARDARRTTNSRGEDRHRLIGERAVVLHKRRKHDVELINLSGGGAMIGAALPAKLWDRAELRLGKHGAIECAVRWVREGRVGLEFAHETRLDWPAEQVAAMLGQVVARSFPNSQPKPDEPLAAVDVEVRKSSEDEQRIATRHPLIWSALLHHDYQTTKVRVRNLSRTGAMIESAVAVRVGTEPLIELSDTLSLSVTVLWAVGDQVGLRFHSPLEMSALASTQPGVATFDWQPPAYLSQMDKGSAGDNHWDRLSLSELRTELEGYLKR